MIRFLRKSDTGLFASRTLSGHLVRGAVAFALLFAAIKEQETSPALAVLAGLAALLVMRGCPVCWAIGLLETLQQKIRKPQADTGSTGG
ncbi:MAG: hypothetical protein V4625_20020 [Pseudomonadota bacterium]